MLNPRSLRPITGALVAAALAISAFDARAQVDLSALRRDGYGVSPIDQPKPNMLVTPATINGVKLKLIIDTGFSGHGIFLDSVHGKKLGLGSSTAKSSDGESATGKKIATQNRGTGVVMLGNAQINGVPLSFGSFQGLRNVGSFQTGSHINYDNVLAGDGFLTAGFLRTCSAVVDLHNRLLYLRPPGTGKRVSLGPALTSVGLAAVPFTMAGSDCIADVEVNGTPTKFIMDTGATLSELDSRFADRIKTSAHFTEYEFHDAAGAKAESGHASLNSLKIAGVEVRAPNIQIAKLSFYSSSGGKIGGLLGMDVLGQNWSIIDFGEQKLYIAAKH